MKVLRRTIRISCLVVIGSFTACGAYGAEALDLAKAAIVAHDESTVVATAARMLVEEIAKRTGVTLSSATAASGEVNPVILLSRVDKVPEKLRDLVAGLQVPEAAEGFAIGVRPDSVPPAVVLVGRDERGVLYAAGRLLLELRMAPGTFEIPSNFQVSTAPRYPYRGHQIGYRSLAHCYDAWTPEIYEQYMRELAVFGANGFETTSFADPDEKDGPHARLTRGEMAAAWSRICADYGYDFWLFTGAMGGTGEADKEVEESIESHLASLRAIPHLDHVYLTGGDGGSEHRRPDLMLEAVGRFASEARKIHPQLGIWVSNQGFDPEQNNWFFDYLQREQPEWVTGVVYGAWTRILADEQRARTPEQYPIRRYSDIGHCVRGQYPVAGWDRALARTLGREPFAPRPNWHARIHNLFDEYCNGFVTYSDGVGDDVNKFVWTALGWDPDRSLDDILLDYSRFFFGWDIGEKVREGIYLLEQDFEGPLAENANVEKTFALWTSLEDGANDSLRANWRFQECLLRAYYDHYTRLRLLKANAIEDRAIAALRQAQQVGVEKAIEDARAVLGESDQDAETNRLKARILELGAQLFESIGAQLDVKTYKAKNAERGAVLEFLDTPLNNKLWLENELEAILAGEFSASMPEHAAEGDVRLQRIARVANWEDAGPGGFYDDLGCSWKQPHLVKPKPLWDDPAGVTTPREDHTMDKGEPNRLSWLDVSEALNQTPLVLRYEGLDKQATYRIRVTYLGRYRATTRLVADERYEIHGAYGHTVAGVRYTIKGDSAAVEGVSESGEEDAPGGVVVPLEFPIPRAATEDGTLELRWQRMTGRGTQVAEVWLIRDRD
ncbi:MAG: hypothetical protein IT365_10775 [Candidatus Hydrogenedentes bacterium]|nr:hypothetical protein [Candidatus Hydrogenedentota bacterium]